MLSSEAFFSRFSSRHDVHSRIRWTHSTRSHLNNWVVIARREEARDGIARWKWLVRPGVVLESRREGVEFICARWWPWLVVGSVRGGEGFHGNRLFDPEGTSKRTRSICGMWSSG